MHGENLKSVNSIYFTQLRAPFRNSVIIVRDLYFFPLYYCLVIPQEHS